MHGFFTSNSSYKLSLAIGDANFIIRNKMWPQVRPVVIAQKTPMLYVIIASMSRYDKVTHRKNKLTFPKLSNIVV
ncbi:unnamed protein product [Blepharisma stoltei]|uniref:Uncharacterized protein n=1 Tax=Blepharisma stoltei TaxID=1481888 RepID=A0AAU9IXN6_9CILI|nr:unnamed protein product [Blepharisma stoltei]